MFELAWFASPEFWSAFATLALLEIVLGIDNLVFISITAEKLPEKDRARARFIGLAGALVLRIILLFSLSWIMGMDEPLFELFGHEYSVKSLILVGGGLFLLVKGTREIHDEVEAEENHVKKPNPGGKAAWAMVIGQIMVIDMVFSLDSIITAVGMTSEIPGNMVVMVGAILLAIILMMVAANPIANFINKHPTTKMLALSFILLIGFTLVADGLGHHIERGYLYFAIAFSLGVEILNQLTARNRRKTMAKAKDRHESAQV